MKRKVYIKTFGCQMNENDSSQLLALLARDQFEPTQNPDEADLILVNSCSVREKSYQKAISALGAYNKNRPTKRPLQIGITGCVASQEGEKIAQRFPFVDFVLGTDQLHRINEAVRYKQLQDGAFVATDFQEIEDYHFPQVDWEMKSERGSDSLRPMVKAYVTIMKGCDNTCAFCIVPSTRGKEVSRSPSDIIREVRDLTTQGIQEITLLGQNVNSYGKRLSEPVDFPSLLRMIAQRTPVKRLRFTSPHPKDLSPRLIEEYRDNPILCRHMHLPVQSGSSRILKKMHRAHTRETYLRRVAALREVCPDIAITTDIIVGFPGETDADFKQTLSLMEEVHYDASYSFAYSERPGTEAALMEDDVPPEIKSERLQAVQNLQEEISLQVNQQHVGKKADVLVEGFAKTGKETMTGRTSSHKIVNFIADSAQIGAILDLEIVRASPYALYGKQPTI